MAKKNKTETVVNKSETAASDNAQFFRFVFKEKQNRNELLIFAFLSALVYTIFQICYPSPYTTADSPNYVLCAINADFGGYRPYGYSGFIRLVGTLSHNVNFLMLVQFGLHFISFAFLLFTIKYFFPAVKKYFFWALAFFTLFNEGIIFLSKWLMSDSVFISLTIFWFTTLMWLVKNRNNWLMLLLNGAVLFFLMKIRYTGLIYPIVAVVVFAYIYRLQSWYLAAINLFLFFSIYKQGINDNKRLVEIETFSGFSGWAQANNATAILPYIDIDSSKIKDSELKRINSICTRFNDSIYSMDKVNATAFMWYKGYPGKTVLTDVYMKRGGQWGYVKCWIYTGTILSKYANYLIKNYPLQFFKHFVLWNVAQFFSPLVDYSYFPATKIDEKTKEWFGLNHPSYFTKFDFYYKYLIDYNYAKYFLAWIAGLIAFAYYALKRKKLNFSEHQKNIIALTLIFFILTVGFLVISHPIHYRYVIMFSVFFFFMVYAVINQLSVINKK